MRDLPFLQCKNGDIQSENQWFEHCRLRRIPFVVVRRRRKYAEVHWDCISFPHSADDIIAQNSGAICDRLLELFRRFANRKSKYLFSAHTGSFDNLFPGDAELPATEIQEILSASVTV